MGSLLCHDQFNLDVYSNPRLPREVFQDTQVVQLKLESKKSLIMHGRLEKKRPLKESHGGESQVSMQTSFEDWVVCDESYQLALQSLDQMRANILAYRYKLPPRLVSQTSESELIRTFERAVARLALKHPNLHIGIVGEHTDRPSWVRLDSLDMRYHIEWRVIKGSVEHLQKDFQDICYKELDTKFTNYRTTPGWRLKVLRQEGGDSIEVLLVLNHTNMDGGSARTFHRDLLQFLQDDPQLPQDLPLRDHILALPMDSTAQLSPPAEDLVAFPVDPSAMKYYLQQEVRTPASKYPRTPTQALWAPIAAAPFKTQFRTITIPKDILSRLVEACRHHKTTLTGLLHALIFVSLSPLLGPSQASAFESLTAIDLRRFLPSGHPSYPWCNPVRAMNNYVTIQNHIFDEDSVERLNTLISPEGTERFQSGPLMELMWTAARQVRGDLEAKLEQGLHNDMNGFAQVVSDWRAQLSEEARRPRRTSWVITNLGLIDGNSTDSSHSIDQIDAWAITRTQFIMCANVVASAIGVSTAAVKGGDLIITCAWQDCVIDKKLGDAFVTSLEIWLKFTSRYSGGWPAPGPRGAATQFP
ncbi:Alcohol acetyltransferase [Kalmusia sp. IMI 367209]|nr:Alcohol acetyltransferase [Kalmusia sp. IMI 367209]